MHNLADFIAGYRMVHYVCGCGFTASDTNRARAKTAFNRHVRETNERKKGVQA